MHRIFMYEELSYNYQILKEENIKLNKEDCHSDKNDPNEKEEEINTSIPS